MNLYAVMHGCGHGDPTGLAQPRAEGSHRVNQSAVVDLADADDDRAEHQHAYQREQITHAAGRVSLGM